MYYEFLNWQDPIIESLLDVDFYKFTMGQVINKFYPHIDVTFGLTNRTKGVPLAYNIHLNQLREEFDYAQTIRLTKSESHYLRGTNEYQDRMFSEDYLTFFNNFRLPDYELKTADGHIVLEFPGKWSETTYWETIALATVNELYFRSQLQKMTRREVREVFDCGKRRLEEKIRMLEAHPDITFTDFGTRRRFSRLWQNYVVATLAERLPKNFLGTSNTLLAMKHSLLPMGTRAHELDSVVAGIFFGKPELAIVKNLGEWWDTYGWGLSIALPDTFSSDFFFKVMTPQQAANWKGMRHDSGDPIAFGEKVIAFYKSCGVDPTQKLIVFSDGLDIGTIIKIADHFEGRIKVSFGWGTNLTNDLGLKPLSLVVKAIKADGRGLVKLSDNIAKAIGDPSEIEFYKVACGYASAFNQECKY